MGEVASRAQARTSAEVGNEILKATFMEQVRTLGGGSKKTPKATFTEPARISGMAGNMMRISLSWMVPLFLGVVDVL